MNVEDYSMRGKQRQAIQQTTIMLPYFDEEVPALFLADGTAYIPVRSLCRILGLRAETYIPRWRKLVLWASARKLPLQTTRGQRIVWCLHMGALPFWCACFNWSLVSAERREQLRQATDAWLEDVAQAHSLMLDRYRSLRRYLFEFLVAYCDVEDRLRHCQLRLSPTLDVAVSRQLEMLITQGCMIIDQATVQARKMLGEQAMTPIADVVTLNANGEVTEIGTLPLFPVVSSEDCVQFFTSMCKLAQWQKETITFLDKLIFSQDSDQNEEA